MCTCILNTMLIMSKNKINRFVPIGYILIKVRHIYYIEKTLKDSTEK